MGALPTPGDRGLWQLGRLSNVAGTSSSSGAESLHKRWDGAISDAARPPGEFELRAQRVDVALLVRQEFHGWHSLDETIKSLEKEVSAADENFKLLQEEYKQKIASNLEVQVGQDLLLSARLALEAARLDRKAAWYRILFATGSLP
jgi:hypothetical protein